MCFGGSEDAPGAANGDHFNGVIVMNPIVTENTGNGETEENVYSNEDVVDMGPAKAAQI